MPVIYDGVAIRPAPEVTFARTKKETADGRFIGWTTVATLRGTIVPDKPDGTEVAVATDGKLSAILARQKFLRETFAKDGRVFEIIGWDGATSVRMNPKVEGVEFAEGNWFARCDYTVTLRAESISGESSGDNVSDVSEEWNFEEAENPRLTKATHTISARGVASYDGSGLMTPGHEVAKAFVQSKLGLGWDGTTAFSPKSGSDLADASNAVISSKVARDHTVIERIDEAGGTYSATEVWLLSENPYWEDYTIVVRRPQDDPGVSAVVSVSGSLHGMKDAKGNYDSAYANATARWNTLKDLLYGRAQSASGITLATAPTASEATHDVQRGVISYQYEFSDRVVVDGAYETYSVQKTSTAEEPYVVVGVEGTIKGVTLPDDADPRAARLQRAESRWAAVKGLLYARAVAKSGVSGLKVAPKSARSQVDVSGGSISYTYEFDDREPATAKDECVVTRRVDRQDGTTTVTVEGTVTGLRSAEGTDDRYANASAYFQAKEPNMLGVAALYVGVDDVTPTFLSSSVGHNPLGGSITYSYSYSSQKGPCTSGALSEVITVQDEDAVPVVATISVLGRAAGPILQDLGTVTAKTRQVTFEVVFPPQSPCKAGDPPAIDFARYVPNGSRVFKTQDAKSWTPGTGRLVRTLAWIYT